MKIVVAPDKFKGTATADEACDALEEGIRRVLPDAEVVRVPLADGGEGTLQAALSAGATAMFATVTGPLGNAVEAHWAALRGPLGTTAVIESAIASGLALVDPTPETARTACSTGTGELILAALEHGVSEIVLGLGGSAMSDGGAGALQALGARIRDADGETVGSGGAALRTAATLDLSDLDPRLHAVRLRLAVDVDNPLTGPRGAAAVFGPQKGADAETVDVLEEGLRRWSALLESTTGRSPELPGSGAAGGLPAAFLATTGAECVEGSALVAELVDLDRLLHGADLVIVGEGSLDEQSLGGKAPIAAARRAAARGIPVAAVAGVVSVSDDILAAHGIAQLIALADLAGDAASARRDARHWLTEAGAQIAASPPAAARPVD